MSLESRVGGYWVHSHDVVSTCMRLQALKLKEVISSLYLSYAGDGHKIQETSGSFNWRHQQWKNFLCRHKSPALNSDSDIPQALLLKLIDIFLILKIDPILQINILPSLVSQCSAFIGLHQIQAKPEVFQGRKNWHTTSILVKSM